MTTPKHKFGARVAAYGKVEGTRLVMSGQRGTVTDRSRFGTAQVQFDETGNKWWMADDQLRRLVRRKRKKKKAAPAVREWRGGWNYAGQVNSRTLVFIPNQTLGEPLEHKVELLKGTTLREVR